MEEKVDVTIVEGGSGGAADHFNVSLGRSASSPTDDQALWVAIRNRTNAISFGRYRDYIKKVFCDDSNFTEENLSKPGVLLEGLNGACGVDRTRLSLHAVDSFNVLKMATEVFLLLECGVVIAKNNAYREPASEVLFDENEESGRLMRDAGFDDLYGLLGTYLGTPRMLPYLKSVLSPLLGASDDKKIAIPYCIGVLEKRVHCPCMLELIWSYWHEEGMLVQSMNAIGLRFQNRRGAGSRDPLAELEMDPLRPINNLLWGYIQNEHNRLNVPRRAYEYDHHYGISLYGKAVPRLRSADSRSKFLEAFHNLLYRTSIFYRQDADTTVVADAFPLLNALREVHMVLAEGAHNQFGELPWTARVEMLMEQWLLARPEMQSFLRGRQMVPYRETWMGTVDAMKKVQGWSDTTITHFHELATAGEQVLLSIRYGAWINVNNQDNAKNWARYWKPEIQSYIHAYRAVTGVDLTTEPVDATPPWVHLKRQEERKRAGRR